MENHQYKEALQLLNQILEHEGADPQWLVVSGGAALQATGVIQRATKDIDVMATRSEIYGDLSSAYPLSVNIKQAAKQVAELLSLPPNWINASAAFFQLPLENYPAYFWQDLSDVEYGSHLKISYLSRPGLITLKLYAALNRKEQRDLTDLEALAPNEQELHNATDWVFDQALDTNAHTDLITILQYLGHESLAAKYPV
jgi:hypothetical protein